MEAVLACVKELLPKSNVSSKLSNLNGSVEAAGLASDAAGSVPNASSNALMADAAAYTISIQR